MNKIIFFFSALFFAVIFSFDLFCQDNSAIIKETKVLTSDKVNLYVKTAGRGPVCIFVHGGPGAWSKSFEEFGGIPLEDFLTIVYYDQRGCGRSDTANDYSINSMINDIESIRKALNTDSVYLLAHSFGGIIALNYALKYPQHIKGLILANATLDVNYSLMQQIEQINFLTSSNIKVKNTDSLLQVFSEARKLLSDKGYDYLLLSDNKLSVEKVDLVDKANPGNYDFQQKMWSMKEYFTDFTQLTKDVTVPVLVITGRKDYSIGINHFKSFNFPNRIISRLNGGHLLYIDRNEEFVFVINTFVTHGLNYTPDEEK